MDEVEKAVLMIDEDGSGEIEWEEFEHWWNSEDKFSDFEHLLDDSAFYKDEHFKEGAVEKEDAEEQVDEWPSGLLHPFGTFRTLWDSLSAIAISYSALMVPYRMAFALEPVGGSLVFDRMVDISFIMDIFFTFFTGYHDAQDSERADEMVVDRGAIANNYLKGWFAPDFLASFPFDSVAKLFVDPADADSLRILKLIRLLRLLKIMRMVKMSRLLVKIQESMQIKSGIMFSIKFTLMSAVTAHYLACGWYLESLDEAPWVICQLKGWRGEHMIQSQYSASGNPLMAGPGMEGLRTEPSLSSCDPCGADGDPWADGCCPGCVPHYTYDGVLMNNATFRAEITNQTRVQDFPAFQTIKPLSNWVYRYFFAHSVPNGAQWQQADPCHGLEESMRDTRECFPLTEMDKNTGVESLKFPLGHVSKGDIYVSAFYWSITTMTTLGYGEINASDNEEMKYVMVAIAIGCVVFAYGITNMCTLVANLDAQSVFAQGRSDEIIEWMTKNRVPGTMKKKVMQYFTYKTDYSPVFYHEGGGLILELSVDLQQELKQAVMVPILKYSPVFAGRDDAEAIMVTLAGMLEGDIFAPAEDMVEIGVPMRGMFLIVHGTATIFDSAGETVGGLSALDSYGEWSLKGKFRGAQQVQAGSFLDVYLLPQQKFFESCKKDRLDIETVFEWDKVDNVCKEADPPQNPRQIESVPDSEYELRKLRAECTEQEELLTSLLETVENLSTLRNYTVPDTDDTE